MMAQEHGRVDRQCHCGSDGSIRLERDRLSPIRDTLHCEHCGCRWLAHDATRLAICTNKEVTYGN